MRSETPYNAHVYIRFLQIFLFQATSPWFHLT
jgi:hypothetical protein